MPRICTICSHPERMAIERTMVSGVSYRRIATQYRVSDSACRRHRPHMQEIVAAAISERSFRTAHAVATQLEKLHARTEKLLDAAESKGEIREALQAIRTASELLGRIAEVVPLDSERSVNRIQWVDPISQENSDEEAREIVQ
jgi:hypothetical protein